MLPAFGAFTGMHADAGRRRATASSRWPTTRVQPLTAGRRALHWPAMSPIRPSNPLIARAEALLGAPRSRAAASADGARLGARRSPFATASAAARACIEPVRHVAPIRLADLVEVEPQKERLLRNTEQFVAGQAPTTCC